jgi:hypothetical protein
VRALLLVFLFVAADASASQAPTISSARSVEAFRVAPLFDEHYTASKRFRGQKLVAGPQRLSAADAAMIARELERVYPVDWPELYCAFAPRYAVRFHCSAGAIDVLLCPHCGEVHFLFGKQVRRASMQERQSKILGVLTHLFPRFPLRANET